MILSIGKYIESISASRMLIAKQKEELDVLNKSLECKVAERTQKLEEQNKKLRDHAFYNAHLLRGPFCRIQGLINLQELVTDETEQLGIEQKLKFSIKELEERISEIQKIVDCESESIRRN
jgi:nitrate/nitrite-specific signal transduction histidine kinase